MKKALSLILSLVFTLSLFTVFIFASDDIIDENQIYNGAEYQFTGTEHINLSAKSAILMDAKTGTVLYAKNQNEPLPPASVTKIMTLLLTVEAIEKGIIKQEDKVVISENAASMGGSQIFLKEGEEFSVLDLLKSAIIASANDAAVALAETVAGSEAAFVSKMNERAAELGLKNTCFENATGLDDTVTKHLTSAYDIALMSRELIKHDIILKYSSLWQDSVRDGEFVLTNTNRLVRFYQGCTGLKTGSTDKAGFCVSATAERDGMHLIAVIMGAESRDIRNSEARMLLDYGFASYALYNDPSVTLEKIPVLKGKVAEIYGISQGFSALISKSDKGRVEKTYDLPENIIAPISKGQVIGTVTYSIDGREIGKTDIVSDMDVGALTYFDVFLRLITKVLVGK